MNSLQLFVAGRLKELGISRVELIRRAGYASTVGGLKALEAYEQGFGHPFLGPKLHLALEVSRQTLLDEVSRFRTRRREEARREARKNFVPFLYAATEATRPSSVALCAFVGSTIRYTRLPEEFSALATPEEQAAFVRPIIQQLTARYKGHVPFFGPILHFVLTRSFDEPEEDHLVFDLEGSLLPKPAPSEKEIRYGRSFLVP